jgi:hypothetical protein
VSIIILAPALLVTLLGHWDGNAMVKMVIYLLGIPATLGAFLIAGDFVPLWGSKRLEEDFRTRLEAEGIKISREKSLFVGFSPAAEVRVYENNYAWDVGIVFVDGDRFCFIGEQTRFALKKDQITDMKLDKEAIGWRTTERVYVSWSDSEQNLSGTFNLHPYSARSLHQSARKVKELFGRLKQWRQAGSESVQGHPKLTMLGTPSTGAVTSIGPREAVSFGKFVNGLFITEIVAIGVCLLVGLSLNPLNGGEGWYVLFVAAAVSLLQMIPLWFRKSKERGQRPGRMHR